MDKNRFYLDGPGRVLIVASDYIAATPSADKIIAVVSCKSANINHQSSFEKVTGGESLMPRRKFITERVVTFEMEDCEMDYRYYSLSQGEAIVTGASVGWKFGDSEKAYVTANTITLSATPVAGSLVMYDEAGTLFVTAATPVAGTSFSLSGAVATFAAGDNGKGMSPIYRYNTPATTKTVSVKSDSLPSTCKIIHEMTMYDGNNVKTGVQQVELFLCEIDSTFAEDYREKTPATSKMSFEVLDPRRADKKVLDKRWIPAS